MDYTCDELLVVNGDKIHVFAGRESGGVPLAL
jgi:hypothetical protein